MDLKEYLFSIGLGSLLCFLICFLVIFNFDPFVGGTMPLIFFYSSLFMGLTGGFSFLAILIKKIISKNDEIVFRQIKKIFRQAIVFSSLACGVLFLSHKGLLSWFNLLLIIFFYLAFEGVILTKKNSN